LKQPVSSEAFAEDEVAAFLNVLNNKNISSNHQTGSLNGEEKKC